MSKDFDDVVHPTFRRNRDFLKGGFGIKVEVESEENEDGEKVYFGKRPNGTRIEGSEREDEIECIRCCKDVLYNEARQGIV